LQQSSTRETPPDSADEETEVPRLSGWRTLAPTTEKVEETKMKPIPGVSIYGLPKPHIGDPLIRKCILLVSNRQLAKPGPLMIHLDFNLSPQWWIGCAAVSDAFVRIHPSRVKDDDTFCINCWHGVQPPRKKVKS
jgi:hypothetical protein